MSSLIAMSTARSSNGSSCEGLAVVGRGQEARNALDLAGVAFFGKLEQPGECLGAGLRSLARPGFARCDLCIDGIGAHARHLGVIGRRMAGPMFRPVERSRRR